MASSELPRFDGLENWKEDIKWMSGRIHEDVDED
jgi:hypothetical protein